METKKKQKKKKVISKKAKKTMDSNLRKLKKLESLFEDYIWFIGITKDYSSGRFVVVVEKGNKDYATKILKKWSIKEVFIGETSLDFVEDKKLCVKITQETENKEIIEEIERRKEETFSLIEGILTKLGDILYREIDKIGDSIYFEVGRNFNELRLSLNDIANPSVKNK